MVIIFLIFSLFGVMGFAEWVYDAHQRGMERVRKYDQRQEARRWVAKENANCTSVITKHTEILGTAYTINQLELRRERTNEMRMWTRSLCVFRIAR